MWEVDPPPPPVAFAEEEPVTNPLTQTPPGTEIAHTERLGDEIARLAAHLHAATYRLLLLIREFDEREGWAAGFRSCAHWLSWRTGIAPGAAREKVRVARALASLPLLSRAMARGSLSYSKVRALTRIATAENEAELLEVARHATAAQVETLVRGWRRVVRLDEAQGETRAPDRHFLRLHVEDDGSYRLHGRLDPEVGALLEKSLEWAAELLYREGRAGGAGMEGTAPASAEGSADPEPPPAQRVPYERRMLEALAFLAERWAAMAERDGDAPEARTEEGGVAGPGAGHGGGAAVGRAADRFLVVLHVDGSTLSGRGADAEVMRGRAVLAGSGAGVSAETSRRLACDAGLVSMVHGPDGEVLDVGRKRRTIPPALRRALEYRDRGCRFPGCGLPYADAHHIVHWADGGETRLDNLVLLCRRHHRAVHEEGFRIEVLGGGKGAGPADAAAGTPRTGRRPEVRFFRPDGRLLPSVPSSPPVPPDPVAALEEAHREVGIVPDPWTATPLWPGERLEPDLALHLLGAGCPAADAESG